MTAGSGERVAAELGGRIGELVRRELRIALGETRRKVKEGGLATGLAAMAVVLALYGGALMLRGAVLLLAKVLPEWLATLVVGMVVSLAAAGAGMLGITRMRSAVPPLPEQATAESVEAIEAARAAGRAGESGERPS